MANTFIAQLNNPAVLQQLNQRMANAVSLLLIVACAYVLVELTWLFFPQSEDAVSTAQKKNLPPVNLQSQKNNFRNLTSSNIFGVSEKVAAPKPTRAPETRLNLTLKGLLAAMPMEMASAIISRGKNGKEDIFSVGDKMPDGVLIKEIHVDHVVLERGGRLEILKLQKESGLPNINSSMRRTANATPGSAGSPAAALNTIRKDILKNPTSFGDYALPMVVKEKGRQIGYRLKPQSKGQLLSELGIQPQDVIIQVNGVKLNKPQNAISALRKLTTAKDLNIVVKRNGAKVPLNISLQ
jgi:general secretion pathway protein C